MEEGEIRVRLPRQGELIGQILEILGASRFMIACSDCYTRMCRIPGKFRKMIKVSPGDYAIIKPWDIERNEKADIVYIYTRTQVSWLKRKGIIK